MDHHPTIKVFSGRSEDYQNWKMMFIASMTIKKLGMWVCGKAPPPGKIEEELRMWEEKNIEFFSYILLALNEVQPKLWLLHQLIEIG